MGNKGINYDRLSVKNLKKEAILCMRKLADKEGKTHATRFMREEYKLYIRNAEVKTTELPSYYSKHRIYRNYC